MVRADVMLSNFIISWKVLAANWGPRSEIIFSGNLYHLYKLLSKSCTAPLAVSVFVQGDKITPFERPWSTMTKMELKPSTVGRSVIRSIEQLANRSCFDRHKSEVRGGTVDFELLARATSIHILLDKGLQARPPIMLSDSIVCFKFSRVSSSFMVMEHPQDVMV